MNERIRELTSAADVWCDQNWLGHDLYNQRWEEKFAELIVKDMMIVVAAHALSGDSAVDVFANLKRIYES